METMNMQFNYQQRDPSRGYKGIVVVVAAHLLIGWGLISGMGVRFTPLNKPPPAVPVWVEIPLLPPPKPVQQIKPPEAQTPQPETFVPEPEIVPLETTAVAFEYTPEPPQTLPSVAESSSAPTTGSTGTSDIQVACPVQRAPVMPRKARQDGLTGLVRAQVLIQNGQVRNVTILSGPRIFHQAVIDAMLQYRCTNAGGGDLTAVQEFNFRLE